MTSAMLSFVRRQDGGSPCGGRGATELPSVAASYAPPAGRDKRGRGGASGYDRASMRSGGGALFH